MNGSCVVVVALLSIYLCVVSSYRFEEVLSEIRRNYESSLSKVTEEQREDLIQFKLMVSKGKNVHLNDPFGKIEDQVWTKAITSFLENKNGPYLSNSRREEDQDRFVNHYIKYLHKPCEVLKSSLKYSLSAYYSRHDNKEFVDLLKEDASLYNLLEAADVCECLLEMTDSICLKSYRYLLKQKNNKKGRSALDQVVRRFKKDKPVKR